MATDHMAIPQICLISMQSVTAIKLTQLATYDMFPGEKSDFLEQIRFLSVRRPAGCPSPGQTC